MMRSRLASCAAVLSVSLALCHSAFVQIEDKQEAKSLLRKPIPALIADFTSDDWQAKVVKAKLALEMREAEAIPEVVKLLDSDWRVELQNTADLIYPGAKQLYGHGWIIGYDVDWLSERAGWLLEELTFNDFGFSGGAVKESGLLKAASSGKHDVPLKDVVNSSDDFAATTIRLRAEAVARAKTWCLNVGPSWRRFDELLKALRSDDSGRHYKALRWLSNGGTRCEGLSMQSYNQLILPEIKRLSESKHKGVRETATNLLEDKTGYWFRIKFQFENPEGWNRVKVK